MGYVSREELTTRIELMRRRYSYDAENDLNNGLEATDILDDVEEELRYIRDADVQEVKHGVWEKHKIPDGTRTIEVSYPII